MPRHENTVFRPLLAALCLLAATAARADAAYDLVVAGDGSGDFTSVQAAILAVPDDLPTRTTIFIKAGTYHEKIVVPKPKRRLTLIGENRDTTILAYGDHARVLPDGSLVDTLESSSVDIKARDFGARNLTFANTAGAVGTAIAVRVQGTRAHFRNCVFRSYQDTLFCRARLAYFKRCRIEGAVDFIFGQGTAVFQRCALRCLGPGYITAADTAADRAYGFVFKGCKISAAAPAGSVFLGRPWGENARVVYLNCTMDGGIVPEGWDDWGDDRLHDTAFFAEYRSAGAGADPDSRAAWSHRLADPDAGKYTLGNIFHLPPATGAPWYANY